MSQATHWKNREEICSVKQIQNIKGIKGKVTSVCNNTSREFDATCQKFNKKFLVQQVASREEVQLFRRELSVSC